MTADRDYSANPAAHRRYLEGRYLWNRRTGESLDAAAAAFEQVVTLDPTHADAHAALAQTHLLRSYYGSHPPMQVIPLARAAAQRALELNDSIGAAHAVLATIAFQFDWDWDRAERGFQNALRLAPNDPTTHQWYGEMLQWRGRFDEAQSHYRKAFELDPQSLVIRTTLAGADLWSGDYRAAQAQLEDVLRLDPNFAYARSNLGLALLFQNRTPAAVIQLERAQSLFGDRAVNASLAHAQARLGDAASARAALVELARLTQTGEYVAPFRFAVIHMGLDETDDALAWLARGIEAHDDHLVGLAVEPRFASLHGDPQFEDILRRLGLHDVKRSRENVTASAIHERGWAASGGAPILPSAALGRANGASAWMRRSGRR